MRRFTVAVLLFIFSFLITTLVSAQSTDCGNRYLTLVNPVRSRQLWFDKTIQPLNKQYEAIRRNDFSATWLLQYDVLEDKDLIKEIKDFDDKQEKGIFLEISENFARDSRVIYPYNSPWFSPDAVFLSAYNRSDRRKLIDRLFSEFKKVFGFYPESAGAWWIDSYSLNYMKEKYGIKTVMIVADQKTTDNYGVWGQWWGVPYYPSKADILTPADNIKNKQDVAVIQWAQRDPALAYGEGISHSNYSMQANDYIRQGKKTDYFIYLMDIYLDCKNPLGQITVGLETGSDSVAYAEEYQKQLEVLKSNSNLKSVSMTEFYDNFKKIYPDYPKKIIIGSEESVWEMTPQKRVSRKLNEITLYNPHISFDDYFIAKRDKFLNRILPQRSTQKNNSLNLSFFVFSFLILAVYSILKKEMKAFAVSVLFSIASFGFIFRSGFNFGWQVYYGPSVLPLYLYQIMLPFASFLFILFLKRINIINLWMLPLAFSFDPLILSLRASYISEKFYFGISPDALRFLGITLGNGFGLGFVNADFPSYLAEGLLKIDYLQIRQNLIPYLFFYPLIHILPALLLTIVFKKSFRFKPVIITVLIFLFLIYLSIIFTADPVSVAPIS